MRPIDVDALPLLLCGPILRRVSTTDVSVFVVLKEHRWVQLKLYSQAKTFDTSHNFVDNPIVGLTFPIQDIVRLGEHFFVGMATLTLPDDQPLTAGLHYWYNVFLHDTADGAGGAVSLAQTEFQLLTLANDHRIGFGHEDLPGFVVPPQDLEQLNIVQGSCRKPHGMGIDMLAAADNLLVRDGVERTGPDRPHLLIHGGDQIYADDVSASFLRLIHDTSNALLGWDETLDGTGPHNAAVDVMTGALTTLRTEVATWSSAPIDLTDPIDDHIEQLADLLSDAIGAVRYSDNIAENLLVTQSLKFALRAVEADAREWVEDNDTSFDPGDAIKLLTRLIADVSTWFETYDELFEPLSTARSWGRIALAQGKADEAVLHEVRLGLAEAAESSDTGPTLHARIVTAFGVDLTLVVPGFSIAGVQILDDHVVGDDLKGWFTQTKARVEAVSPADDAAVANLLAGLRAEWFFNDPPPPADLTQPPVDKDDPRALDAFKYVPSRIAPPQRGLELREHGKLTSDAMSSHLMFLGEFYLMYTMVWSDVLWPRGPADKNHGWDFPTFYEAVPNYALGTPLTPRVLNEEDRNLAEFVTGLRAARRVLANVPSLMMFDDHEVTDDWNLNEDWVLDVNKKPAGAQVLRNAMVAYAVFQDWGNQPEDYLDTAGQNRPLGRKLLDAVTYTPGGPDLVAPPLYRPGNAAIAEVNSILGTGEASVTNLTGLTAEAVFAPVTSPDVAYHVVPAAGRKRWDWHYDVTPPSISSDANLPTRPVRIISLDTRTHRAFPNEAWAIKFGLPLAKPLESGGMIAAASLINATEIGKQLTDRLVQDGLHLIVSPAPMFGLPLLEDFVQRLLVLRSGPEVADFESWQANPEGFGRFLTALRNADCVLISGDVHYAYSNRISFPEVGSDSGAVVPANLLMQLCSSSMKNETALTQVLGAIGRSGRLVDFAVPVFEEIGEVIAVTLDHLRTDIGDGYTALKNGTFFEWWDETAPLLAFWESDAWSTFYLKLKDSMLYSLNVASPAGLVAVAPEVIAFVMGDLFSGEDGVYARDGFTIHFDKDVRDMADRRAGILAINGAGTDIDARIPDAPVRLAEMSEVVGYNNIGQIKFTGPGTSETDVVHELLWHPHGENNKPIREPAAPITAPPLASTVHGQLPILAAIPERIAQVAREQFEIWGRSTVLEKSDLGIQLLLERRGIMAARYDQQLIDEVSEDNLFSDMTFTKATTTAWSALFVSHVMHLAQVGDLWFPSPRHIDYVRAANENGSPANPFRLYGRDETPVRVGDVVGGWDMTVGQATTPLSSGIHVPTHFDIVVAIHEADEHLGQLHMHMIGGNVDDEDGHKAITANNRERSLTAQGHLPDRMNYLIRAEVP